MYTFDIVDEFYCRSRDTICGDGTIEDCKKCPFPVVYPKITDSAIPFVSAVMSDTPLAKKGVEIILKAVKK